VFVSYSREGMDPQMKREMPYAIALNIVVAFLIVALLKATDSVGYFGRVLFVTAIGVVIALGGVAPNWIWWRFSTDFTLVNCADTVIGWFVAGLIIAALTGEERSRLGATYRRRI